MLILITGVLNPFFFLLGSCFSCTENLDSIPRNTISTFTGFCAVSEFVGIFFLIAEDFFVFTGPEYEHFNFIWKAFLWAKGHFIACPSGFRDILKTNNYGGSLSLSHCAFVLLNLWKQRKLFWNKLDTIITRKMNSCLKSACLWWVFKSPVLIFCPAPPKGSLQSICLTHPFIMIPIEGASYHPYISYFMNLWACFKSCLTFPLI